MTVLVETRHPAEFILSEASGQRSRDGITIASGAGIIAAGTVLGKVTATGKYVASAVGASDGSEVPAAINIHGADASAADVQVTRLLRDSARTVDIPLVDHVIVGRPGCDPVGRGWFSFREAGLL